MSKKLFAEIKRRAAQTAAQAERPQFDLSVECFDKQINFISDPVKFRTAVCSRRCLAAGTLVLTTKGPKKIEDITTADYVYNEHGQPIKVLKTFYNGKKEVYSLTSNTKEMVKATADHVFLTHHTRIKEDKERPVKDFYKGVKIVRQEIKREEGKNVPYAYALGALLGDGCSRQGTRNYLCISSENNLIPNEIGRQLNASKVVKQHVSNYTYNIWTQTFPKEYNEWCKGRYAHEKIMDVQEVLSWDRPSRLAFVAGLLDTDGSVCIQKDGIQIDVSMQAKSIIDGLQILFLDLFQFSPSISKDNRAKYKNGPVYCIRLKHNYFGKKILKELTPYLQSGRKKFKLEYEQKLENNYNSKYVGVKTGKLSVAETYDIHVDSDTNLYLLANGLVTHNSGKSMTCARHLYHVAASEKNVNCLYVTLNRKTAKKIIWKALIALVTKYELPEDIHIDKTELVIELKRTGSTIYVSGAQHEEEIEKLLGVSYKLIYVDECQSFRSYIGNMIERVLMPTLWDCEGHMCLIGTPGAVPAGYFYDVTKNPKWSHHHWTILDNKFIKNPAKVLAEDREMRGISESDPIYQREALGLWTTDTNSLVFKFDRVKNIYTELPKGVNFDYIIGIDIGWNDADAISVIAYSLEHNITYLIEEDVTPKQTITDLVAKVKVLQERYKPVKIVMDAGALGKKIQEEINQRHGIYIEAAEKQRKHEFIELLNDDLRTGRFKCFAGSRFEEDAFLVEWDRSNPTKPVISDRYHSDVADSTLYGFREAINYVKSQSKPASAGINTPQWAIEAERRDAEAMANAAAGHEELGVDMHDLEFLFGRN